jgi:hypothetical protein
MYMAPVVGAPGYSGVYGVFLTDVVSDLAGSAGILGMSADASLVRPTAKPTTTKTATEARIIETLQSATIPM